MTYSKKARWNGICGVVGALFWVSCGGGTATSGKTTTAASARGEGGVRSSSGAQVSAQAQTLWRDTMAKFERHEKEGWNESACEEVSEEFESVSEAQQGGLAEAVFMAGLSLERCKKMSDAHALYKEALSINPKFCKSRAAEGVLLMQEGKAREAMNLFQAAIRDDAQCKEGYVNLAILQKSQGSAGVTEALNNLRRALAIDAAYLPALNQIALLYLEQSKTNPQTLDLAAVVCRQAQQVDKNYAPIYNTWGLVSLRKGNIIEATRFFERAATLDPTIFEAQMNFGQITLSFRGYEDAKKAFAQAVKLRPQNYEAHMGLGAALRGLKKPKEAQAEYLKAIEIDSKRPEAYFNLGVLYQDYMSGSIQDLQNAKKNFQDFLSHAPGSAFTGNIDEVKRSCSSQKSKGKKRRLARECRPGRLQNIDLAIQALRAAGQS